MDAVHNYFLSGLDGQLQALEEAQRELLREIKVFEEGNLKELGMDSASAMAHLMYLKKEAWRYSDLQIWYTNQHTRLTAPSMDYIQPMPSTYNADNRDAYFRLRCIRQVQAARSSQKVVEHLAEQPLPDELTLRVFVQFVTSYMPHAHLLGFTNQSHRHEGMSLTDYVASLETTARLSSSLCPFMTQAFLETARIQLDINFQKKDNGIVEAIAPVFLASLPHSIGNLDLVPRRRS